MGTELGQNKTTIVCLVSAATIRMNGPSQQTLAYWGKLSRWLQCNLLSAGPGLHLVRGTQVPRAGDLLVQRLYHQQISLTGAPGTCLPGTLGKQLVSTSCRDQGGECRASSRRAQGMRHQIFAIKWNAFPCPFGTQNVLEVCSERRGDTYGPLSCPHFSIVFPVLIQND